MLYTFYENLSDYRMAALEQRKVAEERALENTQMRIRQKEDEINKSCTSEYALTGASTTACTMSIGSIFQHCKLENVTNLKRQRRGAQLEYQRKPVAPRAKTPTISFENRRLPMNELFEDTEQPESGDDSVSDDDNSSDSSQ